jgi:hypothetical protein
VRSPWPWIFAAIVLIALAVGVGWWWIARVSPSTDPLRITSFFTGTVTDVDITGSSICVAPASGGDKRCGAPYQSPGSPRLQIGDHVGVAVGVMRTSNPSISREVYVIYDPQPSP